MLKKIRNKRCQKYNQSYAIANQWESDQFGNVNQEKLWSESSQRIIPWIENKNTAKINQRKIENWLV